jgi:predicted site-specific integrase-resolvase
MWVRTSVLARREKVTPKTIRLWIEGGRYEKVERTYGGHYRVWISLPATTFLYARVSSAKQESSIYTQEQILRDAYPNGQFCHDIASGFNFGRRSFRTILERALSGEPIHLVATTSDRITRTGFPFIKHVIELVGGHVELLEENDCSDPFDVRYLISYITSFCNSVHGKRSSKRHKKDQVLPEKPKASA